MFRFFVQCSIAICSLLCGTVQAQPYHFTTAQAHAHNDYEQPFPFWHAYRNEFGSIEADIFLEGRQLLVAHEPRSLATARTLEQLYLRPLDSMVRKNRGFVYADSTRPLQLMIDLKTAAEPTLQALVTTIEKYPELLKAKGLKVTISGNRPDSTRFSAYPAWLFFDGEAGKSYAAATLARISMVSDNFKKYSSWNGKGRIPDAERRQLLAIIEKARAWGKPVRFWNAPDNLNSWYGLMDLGVDYINTDHTEDISRFMEQLPTTGFIMSTQMPMYKPEYRNDGSKSSVRNVILLIGDGMGLPQLYAAYTANRAKLNIFSMRYSGFSKTSSYDHYITDSAPGATALAAGVKTNNRSVGVDHAGKALTLLPEIVRERGMYTGIITSGDMTDATPADFYAHQPERSSSEAMLRDLLSTPVDLVMGKPASNIHDSVRARVAHIFGVYNSLEAVPAAPRFPLMVADVKAGLPVAKGRGPWLQDAFEKSLSVLSSNKDGFLLVAEGAQIDHGAHSNNLPWLVTELLDFDQVVAKAMAFADRDGKTLVIVTGDHETGGLTLHAGDYQKGFVAGRFATDDHTAVPVPVFAYGPGAHLFTGVYENTEIFQRILKALKITHKTKATSIR